MREHLGSTLRNLARISDILEIRSPRGMASLAPR
jgi:hypothetical protein